MNELRLTNVRISIPELPDHPMTPTEADTAYKVWKQKKAKPDDRAVLPDAFTLQGYYHNWPASGGNRAADTYLVLAHYRDNYVKRQRPR